MAELGDLGSPVGRRVRTLTAHALEAYEDKVMQHSILCAEINREIDRIINEDSDLQVAKQQLEDLLKQYVARSDQFLEFLNRERCQQTVVAETELQVVEEAMNNNSIGSSHGSVVSERVKSFVEEQNNIPLEKTQTTSEILTVKKNARFSGVLSDYDSSLGIKQIVAKLPPRLQVKWTDRAASYKRSNDNAHPPFESFITFLGEMTSVMNDPSLMLYSESQQQNTPRQMNSQGRGCSDVKVKKTEVKAEVGKYSRNSSDIAVQCFIHNSHQHSLNQCHRFRGKSLAERKRLLRENHVCYRCCDSKSHIRKDCKVALRCDICQSDNVSSALHPLEHNIEVSKSETKSVHGEEKSGSACQKKTCAEGLNISNLCTEICGKGFSGRSCARTLLVKIHPVNEPHKSKEVYAILDDQSNRSLGRSEIFSYWSMQEHSMEPFTLVSCAGRQFMSGRRLQNLAITSMDGKHTMELPTIIECDYIPGSREEIPPPEVTTRYPHFRDVHLPNIRDDIEIQLLIGRDLPEAFRVTEQRIGSSGDPFAQILKLGWVIIGETCLGRIHKPDQVDVMKTNILRGGRTTFFEECENNIQVKESTYLCQNVFLRTQDDEKLGHSIEDTSFLETMKNEFSRNPDGSWSAPLPFRYPRPRLPNNQPLALNRARMLDASLKKNEMKRKHMVDFMKNITDRCHAEEAPPITDDRERWYLPLFGVYHPKKPGKIRGVFDSSATFQDMSLNQILMKGPDLTNNLLGVLLRFRKGRVAVTADIQQMFYCFSVRPDHRDFLRFYWYEEKTHLAHLGNIG
ncbi:uncharacterized protein LOC117330169 [Pecten maximus]|uniref:uncharacterized protein LOC117330169 n=1 Tax=Pecten maximus TaxID=6579 RepID=UPI0014587DD2|nr:uncharacterized protein LOC117330169 [Pecten maximus]